MLIDTLIILIVSTYIIGIEDTLNTMYGKLQQLLFGAGVSPREVMYVLRCDICCTFWSSLLYLTTQYELSLIVLLYSCCASYLVPLARELLLAVRERIIKLINII